RKQKAEGRQQKTEPSLLLIAYAYCLLPTAYCLLPTASYLLLCQTFFLAFFFRRFVADRRGSFFGSPVAAFLTLPPSSSAMSASVRLLITENGAVSAMSSSVAYSSLCFIKSHWRSRVRTSTKDPFNFFPSRTNFNSPRASPAETVRAFSGA